MFALDEFCTGRVLVILSDFLLLVAPFRDCDGGGGGGGERLRLFRASAVSITVSFSLALEVDVSWDEGDDPKRVLEALDRLDF